MTTGTRRPEAAALDVTTSRPLLARIPLRLLVSSRPWRSVTYLLTGWVVATLWVAGTLVLLVIPALGLVLLLGGIPLGAVERWRLRLIDPAPAPSPHPSLGRTGLWTRLSTRFRESMTWRELGYALVFSLVLAWVDAAVGLLVLCVLYVVAFPLLIVLVPEYQPVLFGLIPAEFPAAFLATALGIAVLPLSLCLVTAYASGRSALTRHFLLERDDADAEQKVRELSRSRERIMEAMDAQRRRIERDLHDGAQQRLTGLIMSLGVARLELADAPKPAQDAVEEAYQQARTALGELRELVHGIHPQVLTNRGLGPAVTELAERCPVPVEVLIDLSPRPPEPVEAAAWFIIGEALTNVAKHSQATRAWIRCHRQGSTVILEIGDNGVGGANPDQGTGLLGLTDRASVLRGHVTLDSPLDGPTLLRVELPCDW